MAAIAMVFSLNLRNGKEQIEARHYILNKYLSAKRFADAVRPCEIEAHGRLTR